MRRPSEMRFARVIQTFVAVAVTVAAGCVGPPEQQKRAMPDPIAEVPGEELYRRGMMLARHGDLLRAEQYVNAAIERGFPKERALPSLLKICVAASRLNDALRYAEPYMRDHPDDHRLRTLMASIHLGLGHVERAQEMLEQALATEPDDAPTHYLLGMLYGEVHEDMSLSEPHLRRYLELAPHGAHSAEVRGLLRRRQPAGAVHHIIDRPAPPSPGEDLPPIEENTEAAESATPS